MSGSLNALRVKPKKAADSCVIWLHGLGADGYDFADVIPSLHLPADHAIEFIFPHAPLQPVSINAGMVMPAWYDIFAIGLDARQDEKGIKQSEKALQQLLAQISTEGIPASRILLVGFSQGGAMALHTGLRYPAALAGAAALSSYLPISHTLEAERSPANQLLPIWMGHGLMDPVVPYWMGQRSCVLLEAAGYHLQWHFYPIAHTVCLPELVDLGQWMQSLLF